MVVIEKGDDTLKDASHKHMDVIQSRQGRKQLKEEPPYSQGNESIQQYHLGADQWKK